MSHVIADPIDPMCVSGGAVRSHIKDSKN